MSIASAITNAQQKVANAYTAVQNKGGTLPATQDLSNLPTAIGTITQTNLTTLSVTTNGTYTPTSPYNGYSQVDVSVNAVNNTALSITPTTSAQSFTVSAPYTGYNPISVSAVTSAIDSNIQPDRIRKDVVILGITGTYGEPLPYLLNCSDRQTLYVNTLGELYMCGSNAEGQQGSGNTTDVITFTKRADNVAQIIPAITATFYINNSNELYVSGKINQRTWSNQYTSFVKIADDIVKVVSPTNTIAWYINSSGELYGCGSNSSGQQGNNTRMDVHPFTKRADNVVQVACSNNTTWYINSSGELYGCGDNSAGQQGTQVVSVNGKTDVITFTKRADNVVQVACSNNTTWYINSSGELYGCGDNSAGQQGNGTSGSGSAYRVETFTKRADNVVSVFSILGVTLYINNNGELYGCGSNNYGNLGLGSQTIVTTFTKLADDVKQVACESVYATWYINNSGELYGCGRNTNGQQGSGDTTNVTTFTKRADNVKSVVSGGITTWYLNSSNEVYGCGRNNYGQQGSGDTTNVLTFTKRN